LHDIGGNTNQGSAYLFRDLDAATGTVTETVKLIASDGAAGDRFGISVSLDGDSFIVGAYAPGRTGAAYTGSISSVTSLDAGNASRAIDGISFISRTNWIVGDTTSGNRVTLTQGDSARVTTPGTAVFVGRNAGSNNNTLAIHGTVTATTVNIGAASGTTGNAVEISNTGKLNGGTVSVNSGGTLLFTGDSTSIDRLGNTTAVQVQSGGTFATGGFSEGSSASGSTAGLGALTLQGGATIDFAAGANGSTLLAASGVVSGTGIISILNWTGMLGGDNGNTGNDRLLFVADPLFSAAQLSQFQFYNDTNQAIGFGATQILYNGYYELVPVPEPSTWIAAAFAAGVIGSGVWRKYRRAPKASAT
jgi:hypothetical protein